VLGAGVSAAVGAHPWAKLLADISAAFFDHVGYVRLKRDIPAERISIAFTTLSGPSRAFARSMADKNPLVAVQMIQNCMPDFDFNYSVLTHERPTPERRKTPIYHPHGWLPQGGGRESALVLSEADYHERSQTPYSWSNIIQIAAYCSTTAVFMGHSMTDPSVRALLRSTAKTKIFPHYVFLPASGTESKEAAIMDSLFDNDLVAMKVKPVRYPVTNQSAHSMLWQLIRLLGDSLENESVLYKPMG
jgi:hypothetical protein